MRRILSVPRGTLVNRLSRSTEGTPLLFSRQPSTTFGYSSGNKRIVPIEPKLFDLLRVAKTVAPEGEQRICNISRHCLWRNFTVIRNRAGLPAWEDAFQVMRRNRETDWAQRFPQYAVSEWIGHDITVSASHYLAVPEELYHRVSSDAPNAIVNADPVPHAPKSAPKSLDTS